MRRRSYHAAAAKAAVRSRTDGASERVRPRVQRHVIMRLGSKANRRAGQRRATASAEAAGRPRRRLERRNLALRDGDRVVRETGKDAYRRASMPAAAIAMA